MTDKPSIARRIAQLVRLLSSDKDGEVVAAVHALRRTLQATGGDLFTLARQIESGSPVAPPCPSKIRTKDSNWSAIAEFC